MSLEEDVEVETTVGTASARPPGEEALPPEARGETNGGPLGCCLGVVAGLFLTALIVLGLSLLLSNGGYLNFATLPLFLLGAMVCGYFGWRIGKKVYREYEQPAVKERGRQSWQTPRTR